MNIKELYMKIPNQLYKEVQICKKNREERRKHKKLKSIIKQLKEIK